MMTIDQYLNSVESACYTQHQLFYPMDHEERVKMAKYLCRGIAAGLKDYPANEVKSVIPSLYGRFHVKHCFDSVGPVVNSQDFNGYIYDLVFNK